MPSSRPRWGGLSSFGDLRAAPHVDSLLAPDISVHNLSWCRDVDEVGPLVDRLASSSI